MPAPKPPSDLRRAGRDLWRRYQTAFKLDERESDILLRVARLADLEADLLAGIGAHGAVLEDGRTAPAVARLITAQNLLCRLLTSLTLPRDEEEQAEEVRSQTSIRAQHAAEARWGPHNDDLAVRRSLTGG
jgi:hypothetical protein